MKLLLNMKQSLEVKVDQYQGTDMELMFKRDAINFCIQDIEMLLNDISNDLTQDYEQLFAFAFELRKQEDVKNGD